MECSRAVIRCSRAYVCNDSILGVLDLGVQQVAGETLRDPMVQIQSTWSIRPCSIGLCLRGDAYRIDER